VFRWLAWLLERDKVSATQVEATGRDMTLDEIDAIIHHWCDKLPRTETPKQREQCYRFINAWLDVRNQVTLTKRLEADYRGEG
jgi:hypothetical protein